MKILVRFLDTRLGKMLILCDKNLIGKRFSKKKPGRNLSNVSLDLKRYRTFYEGMEENEETIVRYIKGAKMINAVGRGSLNLLSSYIDMKNVNIMKIKNVMHVQIYKLK